MTGWLETLLLAAFTAGLMGGLHCAAMCGGVAGLLSRPHSGQQEPRWLFAAAYNGGRIMSYMLAGVLAGTAGQAGLLLRGSLPIQQLLMLAAGVTLCVMALYLAGISPVMRGMEAAGAVLWRHVAPCARFLLPIDGAAKALGLGVLWGWLPCGMVYAALLLALSSGDPLLGGLVMLSFGLGTLPNMLLISGLAGRMRQAVKRRGARVVVAGILGAAGLYGIIHAAHPVARDVTGFFCRIASAG